MSPKKHSNARSTFTAVMAIVIAVIALGVGVWENVQMREHNRLSVTPHLQLTAEFRSPADTQVDQGIIRITNEGVGPAVVERVEVTVTTTDGEKRSFETWGDARSLLEDLYGVTLSRRIELGPEVMLGADWTEEIAILEKPRTAEVPLFPFLLDQLNFRVSYRSVYGESFDTDLGNQRSLAGR